MEFKKSKIKLKNANTWSSVHLLPMTHTRTVANTRTRKHTHSHTRTLTHTGEFGASETQCAERARQQRGRVLGENEERARIGRAVKHVGGRTVRETEKGIGRW